MTCIVGLVHEGKVYMGADSAASSGFDRHLTSLHKVFRTGKFLLGYTTSFRMGQILQYHLTVRTQFTEETDEQYMVVAFVEAVRECLKGKGFAKIDNNVEEGGEFLVGYNGHIYQLESDFQINHWQHGMGACGAGEDYALATLLALPNLEPEERIRRALEIASELSSYVSPPFLIESM